MRHSPSADDLRQQMQRIRQNLRPEVDQIVDNAGQLVDWRYYVKSFPWSSLAVVTALGYLAVPRRLEIVSPDPATLEKLARDHRLVVEHEPKSAAKPGLLETAVNLMGAMLLRTGLAYMGQRAGQYFGGDAARTASEPAEVEST